MRQVKFGLRLPDESGIMFRKRDRISGDNLQNSDLVTPPGKAKVSGNRKFIDLSVQIPENWSHNCVLFFIKRTFLILCVFVALNFLVSSVQLESSQEQQIGGLHYPVHANLTVKVFAWKRKASLKRLIDSLYRADYMGRDVPLEVYLDGDYHTEVKEYLDNISWPYGSFRIIARTKRIGLLENIVSSWNPKSDSEYAIFLEDDVEVSPLYYKYALSIVTNPKYASDKLIFGISLYSPKYNQISSPNVAFSPSKLGITTPLYLFQLPCSWGALYYPEHWRAFRIYLEARLGFSLANIASSSINWNSEGINRNESISAESLDLDLSESSEDDPFASQDDIQEGESKLTKLWFPSVPNSRSNAWDRSWKRFYIEFAFIRGLYMIYPNLPHHLSFSTTYKEQGEHTGIKGMSEDAFQNELRIPSSFNLKYFVVPLVDHKTKELPFPLSKSVWEIQKSLPELRSLPVVDLYHRKVLHRSILRRRGFEFLRPILGKWDKEGEFEKIIGKNTCMLDWYAIGWSNTLSGKSKDFDQSRKFLIFEPQGGLTNQMLAFQDAIVYAKVLNRTLVLPPVITPGNSMVDWGHFINRTASLNSLIDSIPESEYFASHEDSLPRRIVFHSMGSRFGDLEERFLNSRLHISPMAIRLPMAQLSIFQVKALFSGCDDPTLAFNSMYLSSNWRWAKSFQPRIKNSIARFPVWSEHINQLAERIIGKLSSTYSCLHLRRGDFKEYCSYIDARRASNSKSPYKRKRFKSFSMHNCFPDLESLASTLRSAKILPNNTILYISTNEDNRSLIDGSFGKYFVWRSKADFDIMDKISSDLIPPIEQTICEKSQVFIGNHWSTFSRWIENRRRLSAAGTINYKIGFGPLRAETD